VARISDRSTPLPFTNDTIFITVHHINQNPLPLRICDSTPQNKPLELFPLKQNFDPDNNIDKFSITLANKPFNGKVKIERLLGKLTYTPNLNFTGKDSFIIHFCDIGMPVLCAYDTIVITVKEMFVSHPAIGIAKSVNVISIHNNTYNIKYTIKIKNIGNEDLYYLQVNDNLSKVFKNNCTFTLNGNISSTGDIKTNPHYDGIKDTTLLAPDCHLMVGASANILIPLTVQTKNNSSNVIFNSAYASGIDSTGTIVYDISENGDNPDPNGNGNANEAGENDPTPLSFAPEIFIPEGFSPNHDGVNDFFVITRRGNSQISLKVYNRWGNIVYENNNYKNDWDGKGNQGAAAGKKLPDGNYFVIVGLNNGKKSSVKTITIHR
jgi:gliding motility-associated-like protein